MSFNKVKAMRSAERYLTQGKIQAAISEYRQIVDQDPKDINTQNMLGDLYTKAGNDSEAVKCYQNVAEYYNGQGFAKKAIAIYNKIHRIEPDSLEVSSKLADLYRTRGSYAEAKKHYESLAAHYEGKGQRVEALAMWESIAELDPRNAEIYLKIAESYWHDGRETEASESFIKAGTRLSDCGNHESAVAAFSRALEITPVDSTAIEGLVRAQITLGYPEEAAKMLETRIENDPYDKGINFLLVDCFYDMGDAKSAEDIIVKMVERDPSNYREFLELVDVYFKNDDLDSVVRVMSMIAEHMLVGGEHEALLVLIEEVLARNPEHIGALRLLARYHAWLKDEGEFKIALERVAESARISGSEEDEVFALSQLAILSPHDTEISFRLNALGGANSDFDSSSHFQIQQTGEVPDFESFAPLSSTGDKTVDGASNPEIQTPVEGIENSNETGFQVEHFDSGFGARPEDTLQAEIVSEEEARRQPENPDTLISQTASDNSESTANATNDFAAAGQSVKSPGSALPVQENSGDISDPTKLSASDEMRIEEETESIRFYLEQGYNGLADKSLSELELEFGRRPELVELREGLKDTEFAASAIESKGSEKAVDQPAAGEAVQPAGLAQPAGTVDTSESAEQDSVTGVEQGSLESEMHSIESKLADTPGTEDTESEQRGNETAEADAGDENHIEDDVDKDLSNSFESLRDELGLSDSDSEVQDDYENYFQHATVYQEMGLTEEAIREFQHAVNAVSSGDGTKRYLNCCMMLGHCFMEKEMPNLAVGWFKKAFESKNLNSEELNGIRYELANAFENAGEFEEAMEEFEKIYTVDVDFRDIGKRIEHLTSKLPVTA